MQNNEQDKVSSIQKQIQKVNLITAPGAVALGLGFYAKFAANGDAFHPLLNNQTIALGLIIFGIVSTLWGGYKIKKITGAPRKHEDAENT